MAEIRITLKDVLVSEYWRILWQVIECEVDTMGPNGGLLDELKRLRKKADGLGYDLEAETVAQIRADESANF